MQNDRDPDPHICNVQSDRLNFTCNGCLAAVCLLEQENVLKQHFVTRGFFSLDFSFDQQGSSRCADGAERKLNKIKTGQSDAQKS